MLALANPVVVREERKPLGDIVSVLVDRTPSQTINAAPATARHGARSSCAPIWKASTICRWWRPRSRAARAGRGCSKRSSTSLAEIDRSRLAGVVILSDGQVHDVPPSLERLGIDAPIHLLLTGAPGEQDRRLLVEQVPSYAMVDEPQELTLRVEQLPAPASDQPVTVTLKQDGEMRERVSRAAGHACSGCRSSSTRAGQTVLEVEAAAAPDEVTTLNNRQVFFVNGVRDRLRVLLVSGQPYPGLRVWRNLLKADPAVDLVHFTILRPPEKQDGTPIRELALIAFPSRELFEVKLHEFDLVIFDRYSRRGLLPLAYLDNVAQLRRGGRRAARGGRSGVRPSAQPVPHAAVARAARRDRPGVVYERGFTPTITEIGQRHPVTGRAARRRGPTQPTTTTPPWGRWFRQVDVEVSDSAGADERRGGAAAAGARRASARAGSRSCCRITPGCGRAASRAAARRACCCAGWCTG